MTLNITVTQLNEIVRCAIFDQPYQKSINEEEILYRIARENGLSGLIYPILKDAPITSTLRNKLKREYLLYVAQGAKQEETIHQLISIFSDAQIPHILLKGSSLRHLYPNPYLRSMGDIDVVIPSSQMEMMHTVLKQNGFTNTSNSPGHDSFRYKNGTIVEVHPNLSRPIEGHDNQIFDRVWDYVQSQTSMTKMMPIELEMVYLLYHAAKHFLSSGIGLRTILDLGLFVQSNIKDFDMEVLEKYLAATNLEVFASQMFILIHKYYGMHTPNLSVASPNLSSNTTDLITRYITVSGMHGTGEHFNRMIPKLASKQEKKRKLFVVLPMIFPTLETMRNSNVLVKKNALYYPIGWVDRLFRIIFFRRKQSVQIIKQMVFVNHDHIDVAAEMMQRLGL